MKYIILFLLSTIGISCVTQKKCSEKYPCSQTDSVKTIKEKETVVRDTTIFLEIPGEVEIQQIPVYIDRGIMNSEKSVIENDFCISTAYVEDGILKHDLILKKQSIPHTIPGAIRESSAITQEKKVERVRVNYITGWQNYQIWTGRILAFIFAFWIGYKVLRYYLKKP